MTVINFLNNLEGYLWGTPFLIFCMVLGAYFMVCGKFFPFRHFGYILKNTVFSAAEGANGNGKVSPYRAFCIGLGGAVGMGNISGVATSIAVGGPGALFWMLVWAFFGMMLKMAEISLGLYYRRKDTNGKYVGSAMDYMERGIKGEMGLKIGGPLAVLFAIGLFMQFTQGSGAYTVAETLNASFGLNIVAVSAVYTAFVVFLIIRGENAIGRFAERIVPIMCALYLLGTFVILLMNITNIPSMLGEIITGAFTGTAATGGFVGSAVSVAIRQGVSRSIYSNEAGNGTSPLIHGSADTEHPVKQGLWGAVEVFGDTVIVCVCTGLAILVTGTWTGGAKGATLGVQAFTASFGNAGKYFVGIMTVVFAFTTSTAWYLYYQNMLEFLFKKWPTVEKAAHRIFSVVFPLTMIGVSCFIYYTGSDAGLFWTIVSIATAFPVFFNGIALFILRRKVWTLLADFKARYLGIGEVDPAFHPFSEDDPEIMDKIHSNLRESM